MSTAHVWGRAVALVVAVLLQACGGGRGGEALPPPTPVPATVNITAAAVAEAGVATPLSSSAAGTAGLSFAWAFGDGTTSAEAQPAHAYTNPGDYDLGLRVSNAAGQFRDATARISVNRVAHLQGLRCTGANQGGWCLVSPAPSGHEALDVQFVDENNGWAVGPFGEIRRTTDGGRNWTAQASGVATRLVEVRFRNALEGYVVGEDRAVLRTRDGGARWEVLFGPQPGISPLSVNPVTTQTQSIETLGPNGLLLRWYDAAIGVSSSRTYTSADSGATWLQTAHGIGAQRTSPGGLLWSLDFPGGAIGAGPLWRSADLGQSFVESLRLGNVRGVNDLIVFDDQSVLVRWRADASDPDPALRPVLSSITRNGGQTWSTFQPAGMGPNGDGPIVARDNSGWIVQSRDTAGCFVSTDFGRNWAPFTTPASAPNGGSCTLHPFGNEVLLARLVNEAWISLDRGQTWSPRTSLPGGLYIQTLARTGPATLIASSQDANVVKTWWISRDAGATWTSLLPQAARTRIATQSLWAITPQRLVRAVYQGALEQSTDGGRTWAASGGGGDRGARPGDRFQFVSPQIGWYAEPYSAFAVARIYRTLDGGGSWPSLAAPPPSTATGNAFFIDQQRGFAIRAGAIVASADGGLSWAAPTPIAPPGQACDLALFALGWPANYFSSLFTHLRFFDSNDGVVFDDFGAAWVSRDGGRTCQRRTLAVADAPVSVAQTGTRTLWLVGQNGSVQKSADRGDTWQTVNVGVALPAGGRWTAVAFIDAQNGWLAGSFGRAAVTRDGGLTWQAQQTGLWKTVRQIRFIDSRTGWMVGDDGVIIGTGTGGS